MDGKHRCVSGKRASAIIHDPGELFNDETVSGGWQGIRLPRENTKKEL